VVQCIDWYEEAGRGRRIDCAPCVWRRAAISGILLERHEWEFSGSEQVSVIQCYCPTCRRTVYAEDTESPECPVCLTRVFVAADDSLEQPSPAVKDSPAGG